MKDKTKDRLNFGLGLLAGVFLGYYISSDEGKELRKIARRQLDEISEQLGEKVQEQIGLISESVESALTKGRTYVEDATDSVHEEVDRSSDSAEDVLSSAKSSFFRGMEKARRRIESKGQEENPSDS